MGEKRTYPRITITLEPGVVAKLPKRDRSAAINLIIKQYYQNEGADELWQTIKQKILADKDIGEWITVDGGTKRYT